MQRYTHLKRGLLIAVIGLSLPGCDAWRDQIVAAYPQTTGIFGGRAKPSPFVLKTGNIRGFVFGADGPKQPIPLAFVTTGSISSFAANPQQEAAVSEEADDGKTISVFHDFEDGAGSVLTERRARKKAVKVSEEEEPDAAARAFKEKYVYLRQGEFFLEDVPEGIATLIASFGNVTSSQNQVTVYDRVTVTDVAMNLYIPIPVQNEDKSTPRVVEWTNLTPEDGVTVQAAIKRTDNASGPPTTDITITYKPDPPNVAVELRSPPGSGGVVIRKVSMVYTWSTKKGGRQTSDVIEIPVPPKVVPAAQATAFGPPVIITVPVGSATLRTIFNSSDPDDQPGIITASLQFVDDQGFAVQGKSLEALEVSVPMRSL